MRLFLIALTSVMTLFAMRADARAPTPLFAQFCPQTQFGMPENGVCSKSYQFHSSVYVIGVEIINGYNLMPSEYIILSQQPYAPGSSDLRVGLYAETQVSDQIGTDKRIISGPGIDPPRYDIRNLVPANIIRSAYHHSAQFGHRGSSGDTACSHVGTRKIYIYDGRQEMVFSHSSCGTDNPYKPIEDAIINLAGQIDPKTAHYFRN